MHDESLVWPNFFIVGAQKCGTTSVWAYLKKHPQVFLPDVKEPAYFVSSPPPPAVAHRFCTGNLEAYRRLYLRANGHKAVGDASVGYLWDRNVAGRIHAVSPEARIVIMLRDPVERAYSQYLRALRTKGKELTSFLDEVQLDHSEAEKSNNWWRTHQLYAELGLYYQQVLRYVRMFEREQIGIFLFEDLLKNPFDVMSAICRHIGVDPALLDRKELGRAHNPSVEPRMRWLYELAKRSVRFSMRERFLPIFVQEWLRFSPLLYKPYKPPRDERATKYLQNIFEPDLCRLEELLERKLPELRSSWV
jgi:hypothetical protein